MQEVFVKLDALTVELQDKIAANIKLKDELKGQKADQDVLGNDLFNKSRSLSKLTDDYAKYKNFDEVKADFEANKRKYDEEMSELDQKEKNIAKLSEVQKKEAADLDVRKANISKQVVALKAREIEATAREAKIKDIIDGKAFKAGK